MKRWKRVSDACSSVQKTSSNTCTRPTAHQNENYPLRNTVSRGWSAHWLINQALLPSLPQVLSPESPSSVCLTPQKAKGRWISALKQYIQSESGHFSPTVSDTEGGYCILGYLYRGLFHPTHYGKAQPVEWRDLEGLPPRFNGLVWDNRVYFW